MKQIKPGTYKKDCKLCERPAQWRATRLPVPMYVCDDHKCELEKTERMAPRDDYMSEADYQTWGRL